MVMSFACFGGFVLYSVFCVRQITPSGRRVTLLGDTNDTNNFHPGMFAVSFTLVCLQRAFTCICWSGQHAILIIIALTNR